MAPVFVGIDGFKLGWIAAVWAGPGHRPAAAFLPSLAEAERLLPEETRVIAVDIPIGLAEAAEPGGRPCDREARAFLKGRGSCVFPPPARAALRANTFAEACRLNQASGPAAKKISQQCFGLFPKLREAEAAITSPGWLRDRLIEVHPEVSFGMMNALVLSSQKKTVEGIAERRRLLTTAGFANLEQFEAAARAMKAGLDDALDACAAAWSAQRRSLDLGGCFPADAKGPDHHMRIWY